jgi:hypothetical protein
MDLWVDEFGKVNVGKNGRNQATKMTIEPIKMRIWTTREKKWHRLTNNKSEIHPLQRQGPKGIVWLRLILRWESGSLAR